eukprot:2722074-Rhodomonas_salina.1
MHLGFSGPGTTAPKQLGIPRIRRNSSVVSQIGRNSYAAYPGTRVPGYSRAGIPSWYPGIRVGILPGARVP